MSARVEIAGVVLKPSGHGWVVGEPKPRVIKGRPTEEIRNASHASTAALALPYFLGRASARPKDEDGFEAELLDALTDASVGPILASPDRVTRGIRGELSQRAFARRVGLSKTTIQNVEKGAVDPQVSTLLRILHFGRRLR